MFLGHGQVKNPVGDSDVKVGFIGSSRKDKRSSYI